MKKGYRERYTTIEISTVKGHAVDEQLEKRLTEVLLAVPGINFMQLLTTTDYYEQEGEI